MFGFGKKNEPKLPKNICASEVLLSLEGLSAFPPLTTTIVGFSSHLGEITFGRKDEVVLPLDQVCGVSCFMWSREFTQQGSAWGGALIGGVIGGETGAIIGAIDEKGRTYTSVHTYKAMEIRYHPKNDSSVVKSIVVGEPESSVPNTIFNMAKKLCRIKGYPEPLKPTIVPKGKMYL